MLSYCNIAILPNESHMPPLIVGGCLRTSFGKDAEGISGLGWREVGTTSKLAMSATQKVEGDCEYERLEQECVDLKY